MHYTALKLASAPAEEPLSLSEAKLHLRVDISADDNLIAGLIVAARRVVESVSHRALVTQTWDMVLDKWPATTMRIPLPPLQSVTSVTYYDQDGTDAVFASSNYIVDAYSEPARLRLKSTASWPGTVLQDINGVVVRFVAGFGDAEDVPETYKQAMYLLLGHYYENREAIVAEGGIPKEIPLGVEALLWLDRQLDF